MTSTITESPVAGGGACLPSKPSATGDFALCLESAETSKRISSRTRVSGNKQCRSLINTDECRCNSCPRHILSLAPKAIGPEGHLAGHSWSGPCPGINDHQPIAIFHPMSLKPPGKTCLLRKHDGVTMPKVPRLKSEQLNVGSGSGWKPCPNFPWNARWPNSLKENWASAEVSGFKPLIPARKRAAIVNCCGGRRKLVPRSGPSEVVLDLNPVRASNRRFLSSQTPAIGPSACGVIADE